MGKIKGASFPFRFGSKGGVVTSDNSTDDRLRESIYQILSTEPGERTMEVTFGCKLRDIIFEPIDLTVISIIRARVTKALEVWEPRVEVINIWVERRAEGVVDLLLEYRPLDSFYSSSVVVIFNAG